MPEEKRLTILLTNDDGYQAEGINVLADYLEDIADVRIVAPLGDSSMIGSTHSKEIAVQCPRCQGRQVHAISGILDYADSTLQSWGPGTPLDCVKYGLDTLFTDEIDIVISGINHGYNLGYDFQTSGTMAAAMAAARRENIMGIAISADSSEELSYNFELAAQFCRELVVWVGHSLSDPRRKALLTDNIYFNLNVPPLPTEEIEGLALTFLGSDYIPDAFTEVPVGESVEIVNHWKKRKLSGEFGSDQWAVDQAGYLSLSVLSPFFHPESRPELLDDRPYRSIPFNQGLNELLDFFPNQNDEIAKNKKQLESLLLREFSFGPYKLERFVEG